MAALAAVEHLLLRLWRRSNRDAANDRQIVESGKRRKEGEGARGLVRPAWHWQVRKGQKA